MDRISYKCSLNINDVIAHSILRACHGKIKIYRYLDGILDDKYYDDNPDDKDDKDDNTIVATDWNDLRKCLYSLNPFYFILSEFKAIENIDEFAYKLADYIKMKKEEVKFNYYF